MIKCNTMKTFLEFVAEDIIRKYGTDLSRIAVVFPNKRASLFLNEHLARIAGKPIWSPAYITISDLFRQHSALTVGDPVKLTCDIHKSFTECTGIEESLDHFYGWGQLLLADFDDLDKNMADASKALANIRDIHEFDDISYLTEGQKQMLRKFFSNFSENHNTALKERFLKMWSHLYDIYVNYQARLRSQGIAYEGMLYRDVATDEMVDFRYDTYLFVGFNVIQRVEQTMFSRLQKAGKARFYWDFDKYYMPSSLKGQHIMNEAGRYIAQYLQAFPNEFDVDDAALYDSFSRPKKIAYIAASTENIQARYISTWLKEHDRYKDGRRTAIVMCDEKLLQAVIHCIPEEVEKINITTGFPLANTPISSYITQLLALQANGYSAAKGRFRSRYVSQVLSHPYGIYMSKGCSALIEKLKNGGHSFVEPAALAVDEQLKLLFTPAENNAELVKWMLDVLRITASNANSNDPLLQESLFRMFTLLNRVSGLIESGDLAVDSATLQKLISQLVASTSIPFHGEPAEGVQIMGVLETRNLDFDHVLILSCNEGNMPKGVNDSSFIPHSVRKAYGLTTIDNKVAVYAYYFSRLLQRAKDITITYNDSTEDGHTGEMSRFMLQLMVESGLDIKRAALQAGQSRMFNEPRNIAKDEDTMRRINAIKCLSPTAINRYMRCPLQFYYNNVAGLREPDEVNEDEIDNRVFGNIFHEASEKVYTQLIGTGRIITAGMIDNALKRREQLARIVDEVFSEIVFNAGKGNALRPEYNGLQLINREVIIRYLVRLLEIDRSLTPFTILNLEGNVDFRIVIQAETERKTIQIGGRIDRMDQITDTASGAERIRIVDYKTGGSKPKSPINSVDDIFCVPPAPERHADYYLQTMLYALIVSSEKRYNPQELPVSPALLFIQHTKEDGYDPTLRIGKERITDIKEHEEAFLERLQAVVGDIFNPALPFIPTSDTAACARCPYASLCGIHGKS